MSVSDSTGGLSMNDILANSSVRSNKTNNDSLADAAAAAGGKRPWARTHSCSCW